MQLDHPNLDQMQSMINQRGDLRPLYWQLMRYAINRSLYYYCTHSLSLYIHAATIECFVVDGKKWEEGVVVHITNYA